MGQGKERQGDEMQAKGREAIGQLAGH